MCTKVISLQECSETRPGQLERVKFFPRMLLSVEDMVTESDYFRKKLKRHNRYLHGTGIVCGLEVTVASSPAPPTAVQIATGYALGPYGDEIFVGERVILDLAKCGPGAATDPCEPSIIRGGNGVGPTVIVAIKFDECFARPVRAMPAGCACEDEDCEYSRIRDSFQVSCLDHLPSAPTIPSLCDFIHGSGSLSCPAVPTEPWVVLASVTLPAVPGGSMTIDTEVRSYIFSTAIMQDQLIRCCCGEQPEPTASADLQITQVSNVQTEQTTGNPGLRFTLTVTNNGPSTALDVVVTDKPDIPDIAPNAQFRLVPDPLWTGTPTGGLQASLGPMNKGQTRKLGFSIFATGSLSDPVPFNNTAKVESSTPDPNPANNISVMSHTISPNN